MAPTSPHFLSLVLLLSGTTPTLGSFDPDLFCPPDPAPGNVMTCDNTWLWADGVDAGGDAVTADMRADITWGVTLIQGEMTCTVGDTSDPAAGTIIAGFACAFASTVTGGKEFSFQATLSPSAADEWTEAVSATKRHSADRVTVSTSTLQIQTYDSDTLTAMAYVAPPQSTCKCIYKMSGYASAAALTTETVGGDSFSQEDAQEAEATYASQASLTVTEIAPGEYADYRWEFKAVSTWTGNAIAATDCRAYNGVQSEVADPAELQPTYWAQDHVTVGGGCAGTGIPAALSHQTGTINVASEHHWQVNKFGFVGGSSVTVVCLIEGVAFSNNCHGVTEPPARRLLSETDADAAARGLDWTPFVGAMTSGPVTMEVGDDPNLMRFGYPEEKKKKEQPSQGQPNGISKPIQIRSHLSFSGMGAAWAVANRASIVTALRSTLQLLAQEELVILSISATSRRRKGRKLQGEGVQVHFGIGVSDPARAAVATSRVQKLSAGDVSSFILTLNAELVKHRKPKADLSPSTLSFSAPVKNEKTASPQPQASQVAASFYEGPNEQAAPSPAASSPGGSGPLVGLAIGGLGVGLIFYMFKASKNRPVKGLPDGVQDAYASKVATVDGAEQAGEVGFGFDEA